KSSAASTRDRVELESRFLPGAHGLRTDAHPSEGIDRKNGKTFPDSRSLRDRIDCFPSSAVARETTKQIDCFPISPRVSSLPELSRRSCFTARSAEMRRPVEFRPGTAFRRVHVLRTHNPVARASAIPAWSAGGCV